MKRTAPDKKRLELRRTHIRTLDANQLENITGGGTTKNCTSGGGGGDTIQTCGCSSRTTC